MKATDKRVLVVDDDQEVRSLTCRALLQAGFAYNVAGDGQQASQLVDRHPFDAAIVDLRIPKQNGHALCCELLNRDNPPKVVVLTGVKNERLNQDLLRIGVTRVYHKPAMYETIIQDLSQSLSHVETNKSITEFAVENKHITDIQDHLAELTEQQHDKIDPLFTDLGRIPAAPKSCMDLAMRRFREIECAENKPRKGGKERRKHKRAAYFMEATLLTLDKKMQVTSPPAIVTLVNISEWGARLLHTRPIDHGSIALSWYTKKPGRRLIRLQGEVLRCEPYRMLYEVGISYRLEDG